ncbi:MAG: sulfatase-like hydrolase/transferase [Actinomycetota bacterium]|nr:sulfatase-like hydrolase/transferase [Actinomycetota bacterium]
MNSIKTSHDKSTTAGSPEGSYRDESDLPVVLWILPLLAAVLIPGSGWTMAERPMALRVELVLGMTLGVGIVALILAAALSRRFTYRIRWSLGVTTVTIVTLFQWPTLTSAGDTLAGLLPIPLLADVVPVAMAGIFLWLATRLAGDGLFAGLIGLGAFVLVGVIFSAMLPYAFQDSAPSPAAPAPPQPDVVLLILDGYTRADILQEQFSFDNTPFHTDLARLGFENADQARANYSFTYASIAAMLDLRYVYELGEIEPSDHEAMRNALSGDAAMLGLFRAAGYEVAYVENAWPGSHCGTAVDICIRDGLVERVLWNLGQLTILAPALAEARPHPFHSLSIEHLKSLPSYVADRRTEGTARLTVAHIILPHPPFLLDAECNAQSSAIRRAFVAPNTERIDDRRRLYTDQLTCTNTMVIEALKQVIEARDDTIVMLVGDHGSDATRIAGAEPDDWPIEGLQERMSILSAYRMPTCDGRPYSSITPVNGARMVTTCALGTSLEKLPDNSYWIPSNRQGSVTDVAVRLDN